MQPTSRVLPPANLDIANSRDNRTDWFRASVIAGFLATFSMTVCIALAYTAANTLGDSSGNTLQRWFAALSQNSLTHKVGDMFFVGMIGNLIMGLVWAVVYARLVEPHLSGPGWRRGVIFAFIPFLLSVIVFFPLAGIGFLGFGISAGPLPALGSLILHLVYGALLGAFYGVQAYAGLSSAYGESQAAESAERGAVIGIGAGIIIGFIGGWIVGPSMSELANRAIIGVAGALTGAAIGILVGSLMGIRIEDEEEH
ncbi:MAG: DUF6789 family protein [Thermomicrobiales bacterium]